MAMSAGTTGTPGFTWMLANRNFRDVWLVTLGHTLTHWYPATFYLLLPIIGSELGLSYAEIGSILTIQASITALSNVPGGLLVDSVGRKGLLLATSLFWVGFPYMLMSFASAYWMLLVCAALVGIGNNLWHPTAIPLLASRFPEHRGLAVALHGMGGNVGDALAPLAVGIMLGVMSWRGVVVANLLPGIMLAVLILMALGNRSAISKKAGAPAFALNSREALGEIKHLLANRTLLYLSAGSAFRSMTQSSLLTFLPLFLGREMGYSPAWIGACMFGLQAAAIAATPIAGHLSDRSGRRGVVMSSLAMSAVVLLLMAFAGRSQFFVLLVAALGFFLFAIRSVLQAWLLDNTPDNLGGTSIGVMFALQAVGTAVGPLLAGILADRMGLIGAFYFVAVTIIAANILIYFTPADRSETA